MEKTSGKKKLRNDIILTAALLLVAAVAYLIFVLAGTEGAYVTVTLDGRVLATYPLSRDTEYTIRSGDGGERVNILVIKDGSAYVSEASCPDKICSEHRAIRNIGDTIVCLPHGVVISVTGEGSGGVDTSG